METRNAYFKKRQPDGRLFKTMVYKSLIQKLLDEGWEKITPQEYVSLRATCVWIGNGYEVVPL